MVDGVSEALRELPGPVLVHCASGLRSAVAWAAAAARCQPADRVLEALTPPASIWRRSRRARRAMRDPGHSQGPIAGALRAMQAAA